MHHGQGIMVSKCTTLKSCFLNIILIKYTKIVPSKYNLSILHCFTIELWLEDMISKFETQYLKLKLCLQNKF